MLRLSMLVDVLATESGYIHPEHLAFLSPAQITDMPVRTR